MGHLFPGLSPALGPTLGSGREPSTWRGIKMLSLEKLKVYDRALGSVSRLAQLAAPWDKRHAVVDQLLRASESVVLNIAEGVRLRNSPQRQHLVDYALGSALECAACLDIAQLKHWLAQAEILPHKKDLCEVVKMLFGLRRSWAAAEFREEPAGYDAQEPWLFGHERLEAYQYALQVVEWSNALPGGAELSTRWLRQIDKAATGGVLNIAEGNGRRIETDRRKFLETAESSLIKAVTYIHLCQRTGEVAPEAAQMGLSLLDRAALLVRGLIGSTRS